MQLAAPFAIPALILPLVASDAVPLSQRTQKSMRLPEAGLRKLQAELAGAPEHPDKAYWQALVDIGIAGQAKDSAVGGALLAAAARRLEGRMDADSLALMGAVCGMRIGLHPEEAMDLVPKAMACFERASRQAPENPRVRFFASIHTLNTPEAFGGGPGPALPLLEAALAAAEGEKPKSDPWIPAWGRAESLAWLALAETRAGRMPQARAHLQRCLQLDPDYGFAKTFVAPLVK